MLLDFAQVNKTGDYYGKLSKKEFDLFKSLNPNSDSVTRYLGYLKSTPLFLLLIKLETMK
jgi:hypothetical protein